MESFAAQRGRCEETSTFDNTTIAYSELVRLLRTINAGILQKLERTSRRPLRKVRMKFYRCNNSFFSREAQKFRHDPTVFLFSCDCTILLWVVFVESTWQVSE